MNIKEVLKSGDATAEELLEQFKTQLTDAIVEIEKEKEAEAAIKKQEENKLNALKYTRVDFVLALIDYLDALGVLEENPSDEDVDKLILALEDAEKNIISYIKMLDTLKSSKGVDNSALITLIKAIM